MTHDKHLATSLDNGPEDAWVSVIQKMDEAYADLVRYQVEVEEKNLELEENKQFFDSIQSSMSDVLIVCDHSGYIQRVNRALEFLTGSVGESLIGTRFTDLVESRFLQKVDSFLNQIRIQPVRDCELELKGVDGPVPLSMNCSPRKNRRGRLVGMVLIGRPLGELQKAYIELNNTHAELKLAQERLVQSEKMASLGRLVAGVAHELNNPISFVYGNMHALQRYTARLSLYFDAINEGQSRESLKAMREALRLDKLIRDLNSLVDGTMEGADRVKEIVNDLRQFSSTQESEKKRFDLTHVIRTALHWIIKESKHPVEVRETVPDGLFAFGHSGQIHQVVVNLIQNAVDAMIDSHEKILTLNAEQVAGTIEFRVSDTGSGVSGENLSRLFDPFFTTKPVGQGTGLGLSISYGIVSEHGGKLEISNNPTGGAHALLVLPIEESPVV
ncbi:ATP-binding protein [Neptuniibacter pectenicola]|jgi:two-component system sensor histidine kinase HupT/HoxJ|uniref:ATP-binding protein n=1 Tax=Neptuniibacter pectenicola TaxID=1806669 RepID=UPI00079967B9|nr:ATP-binding protein [Neptuniibacter pectenicola]KXJ55292.1 MAG: PAS domain-containing sensor histidine kinase [Neptuniibacter sp. Phe_28]|tara:strand:- start:210 stop:1538 length:1329 start_codon:yes stop_codon:yes gene_type:complete